MVEQLPLHVLAPGIGTDGQVATLVDRGDGILEYQPADSAGGSGGASLDIFNVKDPAYGALGDDTADDTSAINAAIAALNTAGKGVLYFPPGIYKTTAALTTITAVTSVVGSGCADSHFRQAVTTIKLNSTTAVMFTVGSGAHGTKFCDLNLVNTAGSAPTAGAAIQVLGGDGARYERLTIKGFWINADMQDGQEWTMDSCFIYSPVKYGIKLQHIDLPDGGDMGITNCQFLCGDYDADAAVRWETGGGLRFTNNKINARTLTHRFTNGISAAMGSSTADFVCIGNSIENFVTSAIKVQNNLIGCMIIGNETGTWNSSTAPAIDVDNFDDCVVIGNTCTAGATSSAAAIKLTNVDRGTVLGNTFNGYTGEYSLTTCTSIQTLGGAALTAEDVRDTIAAALVEGVGIDIVVNDAGDTITITADLGEVLVEGVGITITDNGDGTFTLDATATAASGLVPLTTVIDGVPDFVWDDDNQLVMTEAP